MHAEHTKFAHPSVCITKPAKEQDKVTSTEETATFLAALSLRAAFAAALTESEAAACIERTGCSTDNTGAAVSRKAMVMWPDP